MRIVIVISLIIVGLAGGVVAARAGYAENQREMHMGGTNVYPSFQGTAR